MASEGQIIGQRYRLIAPLGKGGMGVVWRAKHVELGSDVAVKLIDAALLGESPETFLRFRREAKAAAALKSPHVVQIFDYGVDDDTPYIAMELLEGESLSARLARTGRLTPALTQQIVTQVARAIGKAHEAGIVHRDLKPDNIFLEKNDDEVLAKVLDFGIAKAVGIEPGTTTAGSHTRTGSLLGTPFYMSPEQAKGTRTVDSRSDLWSLSVIAFECLVGKRPFESTALGDLIIKIATEPNPIPSACGPVPAGFDAWFAKGCAKDPEARFQSARELSEALRSVLSGELHLAATIAAPTPALGPSPEALAPQPTALGLAHTLHAPSPPSLATSAKSKLGRGPIVGGAAFVLLTVALVYVRATRPTDTPPVVPGSAPSAAALELSGTGLPTSAPTASASSQPVASFQPSASAPSVPSPSASLAKGKSAGPKDKPVSTTAPKTSTSAPQGWGF